MALILAFVFVISLFIFIMINGEKLNKISNSFLLTPFLLTLGIIVSLIIHSKTPQAIDVYRGNTTLEITYKDGVAIDSTVVWKKK